MQPGDRLVCTFVRRGVEVGDQFTQWPLHVTIVPWFRSEISTENLAQQLGARLRDQNMNRFVASVGMQTILDDGRDANHIQTAWPFRELEAHTRQVLKESGAWLVDESTGHKRPYLPHITVQNDDRLREDTTFGCLGVHIVAQEGAQKLVAAHVGLGNG